MKPLTQFSYLFVIGLAGFPVNSIANLENGVTAFESHQWSSALKEFLEVLRSDPANSEAHAYVALSARHLAEERDAQQRSERSRLLSGIRDQLQNNAPLAETLTQALDTTVRSASLAQEQRWDKRIEEARAHRLSGRWIAGYAVVLDVLGENASYPAAQRELSDLQSAMRDALDHGVGTTIEERFALEGFYAFGQADYVSAIGAWEKLRTILQQNAALDRTPRLRFMPYEKIARARLEEDARRGKLNQLFAEGLAFTRQKHWASALDKFRQLAILEPGYPDLGPRLVQAEAAIEQERTVRLSRHKRDSIDRLLQEGISALEKQSLLEAQQKFESVLKLDPSHANAYSYLQMAKAELERQHDPRGAQMHYETGLVAYASGKLDEAVREWRMTVRMNPDHDKAKLALGKVQKELAMNQEAGWLDETLP